MIKLRPHGRPKQLPRGLEIRKHCTTSVTCKMQGIIGCKFVKRPETRHADMYMYMYALFIVSHDHELALRFLREIHIIHVVSFIFYFERSFGDSN